MYAIDNNELYHHGIKGMKWGVRRFQNADGSRTEAGKKRERLSLRDRMAERKAKKNTPPTHEELTKSTNPKLLYKHRNELSDKELNNRLNRINKERELHKLTKKDHKLLKQILVTPAIVAASAYVGARITKFLKKFDNISITDLLESASEAEIDSMFDELLND